MSLQSLDDQYRLTPWSLPEHKAHIAGQYGRILGERGPEAAAAYIEEYEKRQAKHAQAYEVQRELLRQSGRDRNSPPQELPNEEYAVWNPRAEFKKAVEAVDGAKEKVPEEVSVEPKKRGRPARVKEEEAPAA